MSAAAEFTRLAKAAAEPLRKLTVQLTTMHDRLDTIDAELAALERMPRDDGATLQRLAHEVQRLSDSYQRTKAVPVLRQYAKQEEPEGLLRLFTRYTPAGEAVPDEGAACYFLKDVIMERLKQELERLELGGLTDDEREQQRAKLEAERASLQGEIQELTDAIAAGGATVRVS